MRNLLIVTCFTILGLTTNAQYIAEVLAYQPAPGQLINEAPWGVYAAAETIVGGVNGTLTLGAWGGYVVFRFDTPVENHPNHPFGVDFTIFGNALPDWSEPGIVWVMKDDNDNGLPDDTWYELAGSDYHFSNTLKNYEVTYVNPQQSQAANVPWTDNLGGSGMIYTNSTHAQPYYPLNTDFQQIPEESYTIQGTRIQPVVDSVTFMTKVYKRGFGYADNQLRGAEPWTVPDNPYTNAKENAGGDAFDISWAVDENGNYVELDKIHFIKVQNGMLAHGGWLGEISTEITGAAKVTPNPSISGVEQMVVICDLPPLITQPTVQLEALAFDKGQLMTNEKINWSVDLSGASINENNVLQITSSGTITVTATLASNSEITASATATVTLGTSIAEIEIKTLDIYPNPAVNQITIQKTQGELVIYNARGQMIERMQVNGKAVEISHLPKGLYLIKHCNNHIISVAKLLKN